MTHAFDLNAALTAYVAIMLFIFYAIDSFLKYKDYKLTKAESVVQLDEEPTQTTSFGKFI